MELKKINTLLEKYFEGSTTLEEESILKNYFSSEEVSDEHQAYRPIFSYSSEIAKEHAAPIELPKSNWVPKWMQVAAVIALVVSGSFYAKQYQERKQAELVLNQTRDAFELLAQNFERAKHPISYIDAFNSTTNKVFKENK